MLLRHRNSPAFDSKAAALGRLSLFAGLGRSELSRLAAMTDDLDVRPGKVLCREGETARQFFVIVEGEAEVTKGGEEVRRSAPVTSSAKPG